MSYGICASFCPRRWHHQEASPGLVLASSVSCLQSFLFSQPFPPVPGRCEPGPASTAPSARPSPATAVLQELNALLGSSIIYWQNPAHSVRTEAPEPRPLGKAPIR